jgi:membrane-bound lytic murein transglycosylase F
MMRMSDKLLIATFVLLLVLIAIKEFYIPLPPVKDSKELVVVTSNGPNTYYLEDEDRYAGFEYDLARAFAKFLGSDYRVRFVVHEKLSNVLTSLIDGKGHIAAANLSITPERERFVKFGPPYLDVQQHVVFNSETQNAPETVADLVGKHIEVPLGSSYAERLQRISEQHPTLGWHANKRANTEELVEQVCAGTLDYTVADDLMASLLQNYYPNLGLGFALGEAERLAWAFPRDGDPWLYQQSIAFFEKIKANGELKKLVDRYYGHIDRLNPADVTKFLGMMRTTLPKYARLFKQAQEVTGLDWRLIAAISYQESHWDQNNTSPTNVRGLMMLTEQTADSMGVTDRLDPKQSVMGGSQYLIQLKERLSGKIEEPDRTWMTLAAYNIGLSHLEDARILTQRLGRNPNNWSDVKATLPLLNKAQYYSSLKSGYASGGAPVIFVESIRTYHSILTRYMPEYQPGFPILNLFN